MPGLFVTTASNLETNRLLSAKVQQAIERSHCVVVLLTPAAADSAFVQQEIGYAIKCERPVICLVDSSVPDAKLGMLEGREYIHFGSHEPGQAISDAETYLTKLKDEKEVARHWRRRDRDRRASGALLGRRARWRYPSAMSGNATPLRGPRGRYDTHCGCAMVGHTR